MKNGGNQSAAYRKTHDTKTNRDETVWVAACKLAGKAKVAQRIHELREEKEIKLKEEHDLSTERIIKELMIMAFGDTKDLYDEEGKFKGIHEIGNLSRSISEIRIDEGLHGTKTTIKRESKLDALEKLAKHLGLYEKDNDQKATNITITKRIIGGKDT